MSSGVVCAPNFSSTKRTGRLAPLRIRARHHSGGQHVRVAVEHVLDLDGRDVLAARDDDVLAAVLDLEVAVGYCTARSPLWNQPPAKASCVAFGFFR
jgi:hypothetical protein